MEYLLCCLTFSMLGPEDLSFHTVIFPAFHIWDIVGLCCTGNWTGLHTCDSTSCGTHVVTSLQTNEQTKVWLPLGKENISSLYTLYFHIVLIIHSFLQTFRPISSGNSPISKSPVTCGTSSNNTNSRPVYNNPLGLYAHNNGNGALPKQMAGLSLTSTHSPEASLNSSGSRNGFDTQSDVYKMLQDPEEPVSAPKQSGSFRFLQGMLEAEDGGTDRSGGRVLCSPVKSPITAPLPPLPGLLKLPQCTRCANGIVGTIVKARDKLYHPDCFTCDDCGLNLKHRGYFFIDDHLYCETHAKARVQPPEGYDVVAVYPNSKVELV
ncbi:PDZ and LIM domain protein 4 [Triplophysa rosa]|uniref:PDZ and LIM domain protein 4 n=1 Tax=Triplophysa rosa TaxID=992332 RepID=A0A9W7X2X6_TRIRA|nr:PDZ and LIM domain protein 4 [Triplophysa rosa]